MLRRTESLGRAEPLRRFRFPWRSRGQIHREVDDELRFHIDNQIADLRAAGLDEQQAFEEAHRRFGDFDRARYSLKAAGRRREGSRRRQLMIDEFLRDLRYAARSLRRSPGFTATAVLVLALGIGINSAIFSIVNMMMMRPTMVADESRVVALYSRTGEGEGTWRAFSYPTYVDLREQNRAFSHVAAHNFTFLGVTEGEVTRRVMASVASANYFETLGVPLALGRPFTAAEEKPGSDVPVAIVSHDYWQKDKDVLGSTVIVNSRPLTVVGVAPDGFTGTMAMLTPDLWLPLGLYESMAGMPGASQALDLGDRKSRQLMVFARLEPGLSSEQAESRLEPIATRLAEAFPVEHENQAFVAGPLSRLGVSTVPASEDLLLAPMLLILAMGAIVLLIACLNLANMMLARGASRRVELAIRLSLGGSRFRLLRLLLSESLLLSLLGGVGGLVLAYWGTRLLFTSITPILPLGLNLTLDTSPDLRVFAATLIFCVLATLFAGFGPAWRQASGDVLQGLKGSALTQHGRLAPRKVLLVAQIALSLALLSAGGLFLRGALTAAEWTPGFSLDRMVLAELDTQLAAYEPERSRQAYRGLAEEFRAIPGVQAASFSSIVPFGSVTSRRSVLPSGTTDDEQAVSAHQYIIGDDYFAALELPILRGRDFTPGEAFDDAESRIAIIDEPLAEELWPDETRPADTAVGRSIQLPSSTPGAEPLVLEVIGVVPGIRHQFWDQEPPPHVYLPLGQRFAANLHAHIRIDPTMAGAQDRLMRQVRQEIRELDANLPVLGLKTMHQHRDQSLFLWLVNAGAKIFSVIGLLALFLSLVGVYGVNAFVVARRTKEIGVRMALGASRSTVLSQLLRESMRLGLVGLAFGTLLALGVAQLLKSMIFQVSAETPVVILGAGFLLMLAVLLAAFLPARRAASIAPTQALRQD